MSNVSQIYTIVNGALADALGSYAPRVKDTTSFVDAGSTLASKSAYDAFFGALACRISKTVEFVRLYERNSRRVMTDYQEFGAFVQKVYTELPDAVANPVWSVSNGSNPPTISPADPFDISTTVTVSTMIFGKKGTWAIEIVRPTKQIKEAFLNESAMMAFIDAIYLTVENAYNMQAESIENLAVSTEIALAIENGLATNLLQVYNSEHSETLTVSSCKDDAKYLAFEASAILKKAKQLQIPSKLHNASAYTTFTPEDKLVVEVLNDVAVDHSVHLQSNTYHDEMVKLPGYSTVPFWQGSGTSFAFDDISTIDIKNTDIKNDGATPPVAVEIKQTGIVAVLRDEEACKAYFGDRESWELPNPRQRTIVHGEQADIGYAVDPHANVWVFYRADAT